MAIKFNLGLQTRKVLDKLQSIDPESLYTTDICDCIDKATNNGTMYNSPDVVLYMSLVKFGDVDHYRFLYQIKTSVNGKLKNIDSVMLLIKEFEHEFVYADKVNVVQESGSIFVDILKKKN